MKTILVMIIIVAIISQQHPDSNGVTSIASAIATPISAVVNTLFGSIQNLMQ